MSALHLFCYVTVHRMFDADVLTPVVEQKWNLLFPTTTALKRKFIKTIKSALIFKNNGVLCDSEWLLNALSQGVT